MGVSSLSSSPWARGRASPGGLQRELAGLQLHQSAALAQRQLLHGGPVDVVHQVQGPQAALRRGQGARQQLLDEQHAVRAVAAPVQHQAWEKRGRGRRTREDGLEESHRPLPGDCAAFRRRRKMVSRATQVMTRKYRRRVKKKRRQPCEKRNLKPSPT